jgi:hypothetical protein
MPSTSGGLGERFDGSHVLLQRSFTGCGERLRPMKLVVVLLIVEDNQVVLIPSYQLDGALRRFGVVGL